MQTNPSIIDRLFEQYKKVDNLTYKLIDKLLYPLLYDLEDEFDETDKFYLALYYREEVALLEKVEEDIVMGITQEELRNYFWEIYSEDNNRILALQQLLTQIKDMEVYRLNSLLIDNLVEVITCLENLKQKLKDMVVYSQYRIILDHMMTVATPEGISVVNNKQALQQQRELLDHTMITLKVASNKTLGDLPNAKKSLEGCIIIPPGIIKSLVPGFSNELVLKILYRVRFVANYLFENNFGVVEDWLW